MYWWRVESLKESLRAESLPQAEAFKYLLASNLLTSLMMTSSTEWNLWHWFDYISTIACTIGGVIFAYRQNGGAGGSDLLGRFMSVSFVMIVRMMAYMVASAFLLVLGLTVIFPDRPTDAAFSALVLGWQIWFYWRIGLHIRDVAIARAPRSTSETDVRDARAIGLQ